MTERRRTGRSHRVTVFSRQGHPARRDRRLCRAHARGSPARTKGSARPHQGRPSGAVRPRALEETRIDMITLAVADLERALDFCGDGLELESHRVLGTVFVGGDVNPAGAIATFELRDSPVLSLNPAATWLRTTGVPSGPPKAGEFSIGHAVASRVEIDTLLSQAKPPGPRSPPDRTTVPGGSTPATFAIPTDTCWRYSGTHVTAARRHGRVESRTSEVVKLFIGDNKALPRCSCEETLTARPRPSESPEWSPGFGSRSQSDNRYRQPTWLSDKRPPHRLSPRARRPLRTARASRWRDCGAVHVRARLGQAATQGKRSQRGPGEHGDRCGAISAQ